MAVMVKATSQQSKLAVEYGKLLPVIE